jgi:hypothetical protein
MGSDVSGDAGAVGVVGIERPDRGARSTVVDYVVIIVIGKSSLAPERGGHAERAPFWEAFH